MYLAYFTIESYDILKLVQMLIFALQFLLLLQFLLFNLLFSLLTFIVKSAHLLFCQVSPALDLLLLEPEFEVVVFLGREGGRVVAFDELLEVLLFVLRRDCFDVQFLDLG